MKIDNIIKNIEKYILFGFIVIYPVFVLGFFPNPFLVPKEILLVAVVSALILLWVIRTILTGKVSVNVGSFDFGILILTIGYILSTILKTPNKMEALFFPGVTTFLVFSAILYFLTNQIDKKSKTGIVYSIVVSAALLSVSVLLTEVGFWAKIPQLPQFMKDSAFNVMGGSLPSIIYLVVSFILGFSLIVNEKEIAKKVFVGVSSAVMILGLTLLIKNSLPGQVSAIQLPDMQTSWAVSIEALKQSPIFGMGPGNYLSAFNLFRPVTYNQTSLWQARFSTGTDFYLTLLAEVGLVGLLSIAVLFFEIYKSLSKDFKNMDNLFEKLSVVTFLGLILFFPITPNLLTLLFILLVLISQNEKLWNTASQSKAAGILVSLPLLAGIAATVFFSSKYIMAEYKFGKALNSITANDAQKTYNYMQDAVNANPAVDRYHSSLAQVDMALATSIANKKNITDQDKNTITQLVQQAINEGKATVILNPQRSGNWEVLGQIYRGIMPYAQGADQFAIQTLTQAAALDPTNPNLRIELGGVYYALGRFDDAIDSFKLAVLAKPNLANAHYNLGIAYREKKDYTNAVNEMNSVLSLVQKDSPDYKLAQSTLDELKKNLPVAGSTNSNGQALQAPQPAETSNINPPITLPKEATPPAAKN